MIFLFHKATPTRPQKGITHGILDKCPRRRALGYKVGRYFSVLIDMFDGNFGGVGLR